ncbi:MAG: MgPME-cyclase complex family protein [Limnothrix sp.]
MTTYYYALASQKFLYEDEPFEEIIKERIRHYKDKGLERDFWVVNDPAFLTAPSQKDANDKTPKPCTAIISTKKQFITWLKLRLEYVYVGEFAGPSDEIPEPIKSLSE